MNNTLTALLGRLNIPYKVRFTVEETADILSIRRDQVISQLKKRTLIGTRSSIGRWGWIFADDLNSYLERIQAPPVPTPRGKQSSMNLLEQREIMPDPGTEKAAVPHVLEEPLQKLTLSWFTRIALQESMRWSDSDLADAMTLKTGTKVWTADVMRWSIDNEIPEEMRMPFASVLRDKGWDIEPFVIVPDPVKASEIDLLDC